MKHSVACMTSLYLWLCAALAVHLLVHRRLYSALIREHNCIATSRGRSRISMTQKQHTGPNTSRHGGVGSLGDHAKHELAIPAGSGCCHCSRVSQRRCCVMLATGSSSISCGEHSVATPSHAERPPSLHYLHQRPCHAILTCIRPGAGVDCTAFATSSAVPNTSGWTRPLERFHPFSAPPLKSLLHHVRCSAFVGFAMHVGYVGSTPLVMRFRHDSVARAPLHGPSDRSPWRRGGQAATHWVSLGACSPDMYTC